jgi:AcrR family transcriptional regulator
MSTPEVSKPPVRRPGRGAREKILASAVRLFDAQGINVTGVEQLAAEANVSKRTLYTIFGSKDALVQAYLCELQARAKAAEPFGRTDLLPRERLLAVFDDLAAMGPQGPSASPSVLRGCPFLNAAVEIADPADPIHQYVRAEKLELARRLGEVAREAGAHDPDRLGEQLALLYDGAAARAVALNSDVLDVARGIAATLIDAALPPTAKRRGKAHAQPAE